jgi:hypothetical protein
VSQPKDPNGVVIVTVTGTVEGRRIRPCVVDGVLGPC